MRMQVSKLNQGISTKKKNLNQLRKKMISLSESNALKQQELTEMTKRYNETLLKMDMALTESQTLSQSIANMKYTAGDQSIEELQNLTKDLVRQYVEEVRDGLLAQKYTSVEGNAYGIKDVDDDEEESGDDDSTQGDGFEENIEEENLVSPAGGTAKSAAGQGKISGHAIRRGEIDDEKEGADLPFHLDGLEEKQSDGEEEIGEGNPQGREKDHMSVSEQHLKIDPETQGGRKWLKKRQKKQIAHAQSLSSVDKMEATIIYTERDEKGVDNEYQCVLLVRPGATFGDLLNEACAHWGLMPKYTFLEDNVSKTVWPSAAIIEEELPLESIRPELHLIFTQNLSLSELVVLTKTEDVDVGGAGPAVNNTQEKEEESAKAYLERGEDDPKAGADRLERARILEFGTDLNKVPGGMVTIMKGVDLKFFKYKATKMTRDFILFAMFMIFMNVTLLYRRDVDHSYWLLYAIKNKVVKSPFVYPRVEKLPEIDATGAWTSGFTSSTRYEQLIYKDIANADQLWKWLEGPVSLSIHGNKTGYIVGGITKILGKMRLRQARVKANAGCTVNSLASKYISECYAPFKEATQSVDSFYDNKSPGFTWTQGVDLVGAASVHEGFFGVYTASGFIKDIIPGRTAWRKGVQELKNGLWIDHQTRLVELSYNVYNPNYNVYATAKFWIEFTNTGRIFAYYRIRPFALDLCFTCDGWWLAEVLLYFLGLLLFAIESFEISFFINVRLATKLCFRSIWHIHQFLVLSLFFASLVSRAYMYSWASENLVLLYSEEGAGSYVDLQRFAYLYELTFAFEAFVVFFASFRIFKFMGAFKVLDQFTAVFVRAGHEIVFFVCLFSSTFCGFALLAHNIYGSSIEDYSTLVSTVKSLLKMTVGMVQYEEMRLVDPIWTPVFLGVYVLFISMILVNVFLAILNTSYTDIRAEMSLEERRLKHIEALRPETKTKTWSLADSLKEVFDLRNAFSYSFIFEHPAQLVKDQALRASTEGKSSNPWVTV